MTITKLCTKDDVKRYIDTVGRWTDTEIDTEIDNISEEIYEECGDPVLTVKSYVGYNSQDSTFYREYTLGEQRIYNVDRIFVGTCTKRELSSATDYDVSKKLGMVRLTSGNPGGQALTTSDEVLIQYIPGLYSRYCAIRVVEQLLNSTTILDKGKATKELDRISKLRDRIEEQLNQRLGIKFSSQYKYYNDVYGVITSVRQNHDANKYLWKSD
jgi:hypothetical protein